MTAEFHLTLPVRPAPRPALPGVVTDRRPPARGPFDVLDQVARGADLAGLAGVVAPFDPAGADALVVAGGALRATRHAVVTAAFHPAATTPVYAAKLSASLQRFSGGRLGWLPVVDLDPAVARAHGDVLTGPDRYARADEFLTVAKGVWTQEKFTFEGRFYDVLDGGLGRPLAERPFPRVFLSGTSDEALALSAAHADVHLFDPGDDVAALLPDGVRAGLRLPLGDADPARIADEVRASGASVVVAVAHDGDELRAAYRIGEHLLPLLREEDGS
ncbi:LLM class flavin-dependent oxidoreductase [Actinomadura atramentaria]|uniref:LLM class flavin-dependent oxidoreductase n=1 Tax=Actinomadura atramentaria TaxID=1990 RepID=UPI00037DE3B2|nr:LLM class flavin-dependent oxidoreductase [Actinomadura atramentaria]